MAEKRFGVSKMVAAITAPLSLVICGCVPAPQLVKDLNTNTDGSYPMDIVPATAGFYTSMTHTAFGRELMYTDGSGTEGGSTFINVGPGSTSGNPNNIFVVGNRAFFSANDGSSGDPNNVTYSMYMTDGTQATTVALTRPISGIASDAFAGFAPYGANGVLFVANPSTTGSEIWRSDGTTGGTQIVTDINPGSGGSQPAEMTKLGSYYYFSASDGTGDRELWRTDGTAATRVLDLNTAGSSQPRGLAVWNGKLYFGADQGSNFRRGLYVSDGTAGGTTLVTDENDDSFRPETVTATPNRIFFLAYDTDLWVSDGTASGTKAVMSFSADDEGDVPDDFVALGNRVIFQVPTNSGFDLWSSDGTTAGTVQLATGVANVTGGYALFNGKYYFSQGDGLYVSDGTVANTKLVYSQTGLAPESLATATGKLWFAGTDTVHGSELWSTDGTAGGTGMNMDFNTSTGNSYPTSFVYAGSYTFFTADIAPYGRELWRTDGTDAGTVLVKDIKPGTAASTPSQMVAYNGILYFTADDGVHGVELWRSDGTSSGTTLVKDIKSGSASSTPGNVYAGPNALYFYADDGTDGNELWKSDGTGGGTSLVKDIYTGSTGSTPTLFATLGSKVCFVATSVNEGREPWCSDGTASGTRLAKDIRSGTSSSGIDETLITLGNYVYFGANDGTNGDELWRSDGTSTGTTRVTDLAAGSASASPTRFAVMNGGVFFTAYDGTRWEMWRSDGTKTTMITGAINSSPYSNPGSPTVAGNNLFFIANHPTDGVEVFVTDGTAAGVQLMKDINPAPGKTSSPSYLTAVGNILFFSASDGTTGYELWRSDGTPSGTVLASGTDGDPWSNFPSALANCNGTLYLSLVSQLYGEEPFSCSP